MISKKAVGSFVVFIIAVTVQKIYAEHTENKEVTQSANPVAATVTGSTDDNVSLTKEMESSKSKDKEEGDAENEPSKKPKKSVNNKDNEFDNRPDTEGDRDYGNHERIPIKGNLILYGGREKSRYGGRGKSRYGMRKGNNKDDDDSEDAEGQGDKDKKKKSKAGAQDSGKGGGKKGSGATEIPSPPPDEPQSAKDCADVVQVSAFLVGMLMAFMLYGRNI